MASHSLDDEKLALTEQVARARALVASKVEEIKALQSMAGDAGRAALEKARKLIESKSYEIETLEHKLNDIAAKARVEMNRVVQSDAFQKTKTFALDVAEQVAQSEAFQKAKSVARGAAAKAVAAAAEGGRRLQLFTQDPRTVEVATRMRTAAEKKIQQAAQTAAAEWENLKGLDGAELQRRGKDIVSRLTEKYQQMSRVQGVLSARVENLKQKLKHALLSEVEGGVVDLYTIQKEEHPEFGKIKPELLLPAMLSSIFLSFSQLHNLLILIIVVPIYISYLVILIIDPGAPCYIDKDSTIQGLFVQKAILETILIFTTLMLYCRCRSMRSEYEPAKTTSENESEQTTTPISTDRKSFAGWAAGMGAIQGSIGRAEKAVELLENMDNYNASSLKKVRDFFNAWVNLFDTIIVAAFMQYTRSNCDMCTDVRLFGMLEALALFYLITVLFRLFATTLGFTLWILGCCPCIKSRVQQWAHQLDAETGMRVWSFVVDNLLYRKAISGRPLHRKREQERKRFKLKKRRGKLIRELQNIDVELGIADEKRRAKNFVQKAQQDLIKLAAAAENKLIGLQDPSGSRRLKEKKVVVEEQTGTENKYKSDSQNVGQEEKATGTDGVPDTKTGASEDADGAQTHSV